MSSGGALRGRGDWVAPPRHVAREVELEARSGLSTGWFVDSACAPSAIPSSISARLSACTPSRSGSTIVGTSSPAATSAVIAASSADGVLWLPTAVSSVAARSGRNAGSPGTAEQLRRLAPDVDHQHLPAGLAEGRPAVGQGLAERRRRSLHVGGGDELVGRPHREHLVDEIVAPRRRLLVVGLAARLHEEQHRLVLGVVAHQSARIRRQATRGVHDERSSRVVMCHTPCSCAASSQWRSSSNWRTPASSWTSSGAIS